MNDNRAVLITGAAGGIGTVLVDRFLDNDDTVIATDIRQDVLDSWRTRWPANADILTAAADIAAEQDCDRLAGLVRDRVGHLDVLVNCAGSFPITGFEDMTAAQWSQVVDINLTGVFLMTRAMLPLMKERGSGDAPPARTPPRLKGTPR